MFARFKQRSFQLERLDTGDYTATEYKRWQREMRFVHRIFGESRALRKSLFRDIDGEKQVSILDVGAGSGELLSIAKNWNPTGISVVGAELDEVAAATIRDRNLTAVRCDALRLPFCDGAFDYVFCSLFLHHLNDERGARLISEMKRVARRRIFLVDLHRSPVAYYFYRMVGRLFLQQFTLEDGSLSILRAFQPVELEKLAIAAGLEDVEVLRSFAYRLVLSGR